LPEALDDLVASLLLRRVASRPADAATVERALAAIVAPPIAPPARVDPVARAVGAPWFAQIVALRGEHAPAAIAPSAPWTAIDVIDGGLVMVTPDGLEAAARDAVAIAARVPHALVALASGADRASAIDASARLIEQLEGASPGLTGAWVDRATGTQLVSAFAVELLGDRARIRSAS